MATSNNELIQSIDDIHESLLKVNTVFKNTLSQFNDLNKILKKHFESNMYADVGVVDDNLSSLSSLPYLSSIDPELSFINDDIIDGCKIFMIENRDIVKDELLEHPDGFIGEQISSSQVDRTLKRKWIILSDDQKSIYNKRAKNTVN